MKEALVSYKTAVLAKEKGFDFVQTYAVYTNTKHLQVSYDDAADYTSQDGIKSMFSSKCLAPTQSLLNKWLRDEHNIIVFIAPFIGQTAVGWSGEIYLDRNFTGVELDEFDTYEEALEKGLEEGLKLIKI